MNIEDKLKEIKTEDFIWFIYIGIIILSYYANSLEEKYYLNNDQNAKDNYRIIMIIIFSILIVVYSYFLKSSYSDLKNINNMDEKKKLLFISSFVASLLIFISGIIFLIIAIYDKDIEVELAFN